MNIHFAERVIAIVNDQGRRVSTGWRNRQVRRALSTMFDQTLADIGYSRDFTGRVRRDTPAWTL